MSNNDSAQPYTEQYGTSVSRGLRVEDGATWVNYYKGWLFTDADERRFIAETGHAKEGNAKAREMWELMIPWMARQCGMGEKQN